MRERALGRDGDTEGDPLPVLSRLCEQNLLCVVHYFPRQEKGKENQATASIVGEMMLEYTDGSWFGWTQTGQKFLPQRTRSSELEAAVRCRHPCLPGRGIRQRRAGIFIPGTSSLENSPYLLCSLYIVHLIWPFYNVSASSKPSVECRVGCLMCVRMLLE